MQFDRLDPTKPNSFGVDAGLRAKGLLMQIATVADGNYWNSDYFCRRNMQETSPPQDPLGFTLGVVLGLAFCAAWIACVVFGVVNLKRAGQSPHWMWLSACSPIFGFALFGVSLFLVRKALAREEAARVAKIRNDEEWHQRQAEEKRMAAERMQREAEERRKRAIAQHAAEQRATVTRLDKLISDSAGKAGGLSALLLSTEEAIDGAERKFKEGSFVPFWESIEKATTKLANFDATLQTLINNSQFYEKEAATLETTPRPFQIGLDTLPDAKRTYARMERLVHQAHKNRDFANIYQQRQIYYEQCKTNALLEWGFSTLGQALNELGDRLDSSLKRLATSVNVEISRLGVDLTASQQQLTSTLSGRLERLQDQNAHDAKAQREEDARNAKKTHEMLDDIRRRRKPLPPGFRDGEY